LSLRIQKRDPSFPALQETGAVERLPIREISGFRRTRRPEKRRAGRKEVEIPGYRCYTLQFKELRKEIDDGGQG
jgi:hypothetical protein